ncbi:M15 family metallopeptidase [Nocardioides houyundeii]|uniref:M15 family metallopeptidase n=1 Tax=Nocardioides houyundeii TaxID=2045452 RepID=UPI000DF30C29|nr:M15 family metallopeptidase [Nocardioides houyundeii]
MDNVVLMSDPRVAAVPCLASGAPLVDVAGVVGLVVDVRKSDAGGSWRRVREPVAERLATAAGRASDEGYVLRLVEGHRPLALQRRYFDEYAAELREARPSLGTAELYALTARHVSPPDIAPHSAGAAVDVTLDRDGIELDLGCPVNATPEASGGRCYTEHPSVTGAPLAHRRALGALMSAAGFVNYPTEWWHWSYGDRYWAWATGSDAALFPPLTR